MPDRDDIILIVGVVMAIIGLALVFATDDAGAMPTDYRRTYATCYQLHGRTASGAWVNRRTAAHNYLPFGTKIRLVGRQAGPGGVRRYVIRDTGPALADGHLDLWAPGGCLRFGKRPVAYRIGWR